MTFDADEASEQDNSPRELIRIAHGNTTYRIATGTRDVSYGGFVYSATAAARGELGVVGAGNTDKELSITLPIDHAFVRRYLQMANPPSVVTATLIRIQTRSGLAETQWSGDITSMSADDDNTEATFRCPARLGEALLRVIPNVTVGRTCPHILYDATCAISRTGTTLGAVPYKCTTTVLFVDGRDVRIDLSNVPVGDAYRGDWARNGELVHVTSTERRTIRQQSDLTPGVSTITTLTMRSPIPELKVGDSVEIYAGCDWFESTCELKFNNLSRHGGYPFLPTGNPYVPGNTVDQEEAP